MTEVRFRGALDFDLTNRFKCVLHVAKSQYNAEDPSGGSSHYDMLSGTPPS
jgi:hypothetical protein